MLCADVLFRPLLDDTGLSVTVFSGHAASALGKVLVLFHACLQLQRSLCVYDAGVK